MSVMSKYVKSRSGCSTCKQRRVKCDEAEPMCNQCTQKNLKCPGYALRWKWSTKHEKHPNLQIRQKPVSRKAGFGSRLVDDVGDSNNTPALGGDQRSVIDITRHDSPAEPAIHNDATGILDYDEIFSYEQSSLAPLNRTGQETSLADLYGVVESNLPGSSTPTAFHQSSQAVSQCFWQPPDTILSNPQIQVDYFTEKICKVLSAFDSDYNSFRTLATSRVKESLLFFSLFRFITAAFLNSSASKASGTIAVRNAQTEILQRLQNEVAQLDHSKPTKIEDVLLAVIMFGLTANWDGSNSPSIFHYNGALRLYYYAYPDSTIAPLRGGSQEFSYYSLVYWWMGLAFITDTTEQCVLEPPFTEFGHDNDHAHKGKRIPHPLTGVAPEAQRLLGRVGGLVYRQRLTSRKKCFISVSNLQNDYQALQEAHRLEEEALSLDPPDKDDYIAISDPDTPMEDLFNIAEIYRLSALILLYRSFPDLLDIRLGLDTDFVGSQSEVGRLSWVTMLAIHALELLCQNSPRSGTRSIEQILLVIISGELRQTPISVNLHGSIGSNDSNFEALLTAISASQFCAAASVNHCPDVRIFEEEDPHQEFFDSSMSNDPGAEYISEARTTVLKRLRAIREILPYKSLEIVEELILKTWAQSDHEQREVFWMDIMIENGWKFLLV